jgi:uncharacterized protein YdeI (YjbR/CyaY-like superfamily)
MNSAIDDLLNKAPKWQTEMQALRKILLDCGLNEAIKFGKPCYIYQGSNIVILYGLKDCCAIGFMKGALLQGSDQILLMPGPNSQAGRWAKFTDLQQILERKATLQAYIYEAIAIEKAGLKITFKKPSEFVFPEELQNTLAQNISLKIAFEALTPGRQRGYLLYFSAAKNAATRTSRIEKYTQRILSGKGINDCTCGLSQKMPSCDGSHKYI